MMTQTTNTMCDEGVWGISQVIGAKYGIHRNNPIVTQLEHGYKLYKCQDPYGEWGLNPINLTYILDRKYIIKTLNPNPWLNK
jgi:hypothetical protein